MKMSQTSPVEQLRDFVRHAIQKRNKQRKYQKIFKANPGMVFLVMTPTHGNMGDHALVSAETAFLNKIGIPYTEVTYAKLREWENGGFLDVMNGHPILINGGGNLGTLWFDVEKMQRRIIALNAQSRIVILPNTIFYADSNWGREQFEQSKVIYNKHKNLHLYAREKASYGVMRNAYQQVKLIPDMVLSMSPYESTCERKGCLLCLRSDCEKTRTDDQEQMVRAQAAELFGENVADTDMVETHGVPVAQRDKFLNAKFAQFAGAELVITDRLHGMIFCAITGTPCIVIDSKSPKVRGCYEWIKDLDYIKFADSPADIAQLYRSIPSGPHRFNNSHLQHYYDELAEDILRIVR